MIASERNPSRTRMTLLARSIAVLVALLAVPGCRGRSVPMDSGESHFLGLCSAASGDTCVDGLSCICGVCTLPCEADEDCADLERDAMCSSGATTSCDEGATCRALVGSEASDGGVTGATAGGGATSAAGATAGGDATSAAGATSSPGPDPACPEGCFLTELFPLNSSEDLPACVDTSAGVGTCVCGPADNIGLAPPGSWSEACVQRTSDGTHWASSVAAWLDPEEWTLCAETARNTLEDTFGESCEIQGCFAPAHASCSFEAACEALDCGGPRFDEHLCFRPRCMADSDCDRSEKCVVADLPDDYCIGVGEECECTSGSETRTQGFCNPRETDPPGPGALCDGSDDLRLSVNLSGGFPTGNSFFSEAEAHLLVDGQCTFWSYSLESFEWRTGALTEEEARDLEETVAWNELPNWDWYGSPGDCGYYDGATPRLQTQEDDFFYGCPWAEAPPGLGAAVGAATDAALAYADVGLPIAGPAQVVALPFGNRLSETARRPAVDWPFEWGIETILWEDGAILGVRIDDLDDTEALRVLRRANLEGEQPTPVITVRVENGDEYGVLVRDRLPDHIVEEIAELDSHYP